MDAKRKRSFLSKYYKRAANKQKSSAMESTSSVERFFNNLNNDNCVLADSLMDLGSDNCSSSEHDFFSDGECSNNRSNEVSGDNCVSNGLNDSLLLNLASDNCSTEHDGRNSVLLDRKAENIQIVVEPIRSKFPDKLAKWAIDYNVPHCALDNLLNLLKPSFPELPITSRTLLKTARCISVENIEPGKYYHVGFATGLHKLFKLAPVSLLDTDVIEICINIDGLPLTKSSSSDLYPILCNLFKNKNVVAIIGIYHGNEKPFNANDFLKAFVNESIDILTNGFIYNDKSYTIIIKAIICDVPAKCYIKYCIGHTGYQSCSKCYIKGEYEQRRVFFPYSKHIELRSHEDFVSKKQPHHHTGTSILETIPNIDMIKSFPLDYMHLILLGVLKKILVNIWLNGKPPGKLSVYQVTEISRMLSELKSYVPCEFNRKPRTLKEAPRWKATEFRLFLYYIGIVVLKNCISNDQYKHFLCLHVAVILLTVKSDSKSDVDYADKLLHYFVKNFSILYGRHHASHNVHNLLHISNDVNVFGSLNDFSTFPFENYMQSFKKLVRKGDKPLQQIIKRIYEQDNISTISTINENFPQLLSKHTDGPLVDNRVCTQYKKIIFQHYQLTCTTPNNCCGYGAVAIIVTNIIAIEQNVYIVGKQFRNLSDFYDVPCKSSDVGIYVCKDLGTLKLWPINAITTKFMKLPYKDKFVLIPLLHLKG